MSQHFFKGIITASPHFFKGMFVEPPHFFKGIMPVLTHFFKGIVPLWLESYRRNRQTLWGGCTDANPKLLLNDT